MKQIVPPIPTWLLLGKKLTLENEIIYWQNLTLCQPAPAQVAPGGSRGERSPLALQLWGLTVTQTEPQHNTAREICYNWGPTLQQSDDDQIPALPHSPPPSPSLSSSTQLDQQSHLRKHFHLRRFRNCGISRLPSLGSPAFNFHPEKIRNWSDALTGWLRSPFDLAQWSSVSQSVSQFY